MATFRVNKTKDFTVMSNTHLRDKSLSLRGKGLLSVMLSLPENWDYSIAGLSAISCEGTKAIRTILGELEAIGYLSRTRTQDEKGKFDYIYDIYEIPQPKDQEPHIPEGYTVEGHTADGTQYNTNQSNTNEQKTKKQNKYIKHKYGEYENVLFTDEEFDKLKNQFPNDYQDRIESLSTYMKSTGKGYKDHLATIRNWARMEEKKKIQPIKTAPKKDNFIDNLMKACEDEEVVIWN